MYKSGTSVSIENQIKLHSLANFVKRHGKHLHIYQPFDVKEMQRNVKKAGSQSCKKAVNVNGNSN